jgi:hypothetical protein
MFDQSILTKKYPSIMLVYEDNLDIPTSIYYVPESYRLYLQDKYIMESVSIYQQRETDYERRVLYPTELYLKHFLKGDITEPNIVKALIQQIECLLDEQRSRIDQDHRYYIQYSEVGLLSNRYVDKSVATKYTKTELYIERYTNILKTHLSRYEQLMNMGVYTFTELLK